MTGKEIIDRATVESGGKWKPSPGLIYPLLGRLLDDGLVTEDKDGRYSITKKGVEITQEPVTHFYGTDIGIRDPFGNHLRIVQLAEQPRQG